MTMAITTTLNRIRAHSPCLEGWKKLLSGLGKPSADDEPLAYSKIAEINGIDDALWCCRAEPQHWKIWHLYAVWCGRQVQHLMTDPRSVAALDVAERHANGLATDEELAAARAAAWGATRDATLGATRDAERDAAWAAAWAAARNAAGAAAWAAAGDAAWAAAGGAAWAAARDAAWAAAGGAARDAQKAKFIEMVESAQ